MKKNNMKTLIKLGVLTVLTIVILFFSITAICTHEYTVEGKLIDIVPIDMTPYLSGPPSLDPIPAFCITIKTTDTWISLTFHEKYENIDLEEIYRYGEWLRTKIISSYMEIVDNPFRYDNETVQWAVDEISSYHESYPESSYVVISYTEFFGTRTLTKIKVKT